MEANKKKIKLNFNKAKRKILNKKLKFQIKPKQNRSIKTKQLSKNYQLKIKLFHEMQKEKVLKSQLQKMKLVRKFLKIMIKPL